jgi:DNA adenine methylase
MQHSLNFTTVRPVSPPAAYLGGKRQLAERISFIIEWQTCFAFCNGITSRL